MAERIEEFEARDTTAHVLRSGGFVAAVALQAGTGFKLEVNGNQSDLAAFAQRILDAVNNARPRVYSKGGI
jgi:hypothetical protein